MNMETAYRLNIPIPESQPLKTADGQILYTNDNEPLYTLKGDKEVKAIISNNEVIWGRAIPTPKSGVVPLSFRATRAKPLLDWSITGKTYQAWTPSPEPTVGNNKLDNSKIEKSATVTNFVYADSSVSFGSMTVGSVINSAEIKAEDTSYAFSFTGDTNKVTFALRCYNSSHTYLGDANKIFDESSRAVMTTLANTAYVRLYITTTVQGNISLTNLMLNKGNTVMTFEPFGYLPNTGACPVQGVGDYDTETGKYKISVGSGGLTTPIYLNSPLMADETLDSTGKREVEWGIVDLGNLDWTTSGDTQKQGQMTFKSRSINTLIKQYSSYSRIGYCSHFKLVSGTDVYRNEGEFSIAPIGTVYPLQFTVADDFCTGVADFKSKVSGMLLYYELATPTSETVGVPAIPTLKGNNVIDINTEVQPSNVSITYLSSGFEP